MRSSRFVCLLLSFLWAAALAGQGPSSFPAGAPADPVITFDCDWEAQTPQRYTITLPASGNGKYESHTPARVQEKSAELSEPDDFEMPIAISRATRDRIFQLAKEAGYFKGDFDFKKHAVASTGKKTLTYADAGRNFSTHYDYSEHKVIAQLTSILTGISATIEHGRRLQFLYRFDRLGLETELRGMESQGNDFAELQLIAPILTKIANDPKVLHLARQRARRFLETIPAGQNQDK